MTLHSAKGLEFRAVVVAGLEDGLLPHFNSQGAREDIEEVLGVSLDDEDAVLGLHLAVRALRFRRRGGAAVTRGSA